jgi:hypothetical protein
MVGRAFLDKKSLSNKGQPLLTEADGYELLSGETRRRLQTRAGPAPWQKAIDWTLFDPDLVRNRAVESLKSR